MTMAATENAAGGTKKDAPPPYFKVKYTFLPTWTLKQAAYLLSGHDPEGPKFDITPDAPNKVSNLYYWLKGMALQRGKLPPVYLGNVFNQSGDPARYGVDQFFKCMDNENKKYDKDVYDARRLISPTDFKSDVAARIRKSIYWQAAKLIWEGKPDLHVPVVAGVLTALSAKLQEKYQIEIPTSTVAQIQEDLKGASPHGKGAPQKNGEGKNDDAAVDWNYILEKM